MADVNVVWGSGQTGAAEVALVANTVKTVGFDRDLGEVEVAAFGAGTKPVYVAFVDANQPRAAAVPSANSATHCLPVYPNSAAVLPVRSDGNTLLSLISAEATTVWVNAT